ncbi:DEBR0S4_03708g1_1 [Brettanomyces bruxellensis]|uniref:DEBR0S4_03708g1_1 n=1 Tax=Dekkera bruxellensis TaxID=5007 RepID=A0A7D9H102_DEKBR|nr:DEBR0S4_03708g1_1 [Brettanomyces bruxellensis]
MEAREIDYIKSNIYIPPLPEKEVPKLPTSHPSLIIPDRTIDLNKRASCGCCKGDRCIKESASWLYRPNGEVRTIHLGENGSQEALFYNLSNESTGRQL